jgi:hypothetical protein
MKLNQQQITGQYPWMALAVNKRSLSGSLLTKELVLTPNNNQKVPEPVLAFQIAELEIGIAHYVFEGKKYIFNTVIRDDVEEKNTKILFNNIMDNFLKNQINIFTTNLNKGEFNKGQLDAEEKALEWLKVSFSILTKAILESLTNPDFLFQATLFAGINPKTQMHEIRLMVFNLDMSFYLLDDKNLRVLIYNSKDIAEESGSNNYGPPVLSGDYSFRKREIFDQMINLLSILSKGLHA